jgi:hypothetical protein
MSAMEPDDMPIIMIPLPDVTAEMDDDSDDGP